MIKRRIEKLMSSFEGLNLSEAKKLWKKTNTEDKIVILEFIGLGVASPPVLSVVAFAWAMVYREKIGEILKRAKKKLKDVI